MPNSRPTRSKTDSPCCMVWAGCSPDDAPQRVIRSASSAVFSYTDCCRFPPGLKNFPRARITSRDSVAHSRTIAIVSFRSRRFVYCLRARSESVGLQIAAVAAPAGAGAAAAAAAAASNSARNPRVERRASSNRRLKWHLVAASAAAGGISTRQALASVSDKFRKISGKPASAAAAAAATGEASAAAAAAATGEAAAAAATGEAAAAAATCEAIARPRFRS